jgi:AAA domain
MEAGGVIVDHHSCEFFPERFFDLVVVLTTDNTVLYDRLKARGYADKKIQENVQCEIMHVPCEEAQRSYKADVVQARRLASFLILCVDSLGLPVSLQCCWPHQNMHRHVRRTFEDCSIATPALPLCGTCMRTESSGSMQAGDDIGSALTALVRR